MQKIGIYRAAVLVVIVGGCADLDPPARVPVEGQVLLDGEALPEGRIRFVPQGGRPTSGEIGVDGKFRVVAYKLDGTEAYGLVPGTYRVSVSSSEIIDEEIAHSRIPAHYGDHRTSGLKVEVKAATDSLRIELSSDQIEPAESTASESITTEADAPGPAETTTVEDESQAAAAGDQPPSEKENTNP